MLTPMTSCNGDCDQIVMEITDMTTLPDETRPEMFLSGEVHGNERGSTSGD